MHKATSPVRKSVLDFSGIREQTGTHNRGQSSAVATVRSVNGWKQAFQSPWIAGIFALLLIQTLEFAKAIVAPIALAFFFALVLQPLVRELERLHIVRSLGAVIVILAMVALVGLTAVQLAEPAQEWFSDAPQRIGKVEERVRSFLRPIAAVGTAADDLVSTTETNGKQLVSVTSSFSAEVLQHTRTLVANAILVVLLLFFLLLSGDRFWTGIWHLCSSWSDKAGFMQIVHTVEGKLSIYVLTVALINIGVGVLVGLGMFLIGLPNPFLWGALAACLNFVPYLGALVGEVIVGMVALLSFDTVAYALLAPAIYFCITFIEGNFITPMILGRQFTIKPVLIILFMIFFGWMWGVVGVFLAIPLLVLAGIMCETLPGLASFGKFLRA